MQIDLSNILTLVMPALTGAVGFVVGLWAYCKFGAIRSILGHPIEDFLHELYDKNQWPPYDNKDVENDTST